MPNLTEKERKTGLLVGIAMIVFGVLGPLVGYIADMHSFDIGRMLNAETTAVLQAIVFVGVGVLVIVWFSRSQNDSNDDDSYLHPPGAGD